MASIVSTTVRALAARRSSASEAASSQVVPTSIRPKLPNVCPHCGAPPTHVRGSRRSCRARSASRSLPDVSARAATVCGVHVACHLDVLLVVGGLATVFGNLGGTSFTALALAGVRASWRAYSWVRVVRVDHRSMKFRVRRADYAVALADLNGGRVVGSLRSRGSATAAPFRARRSSSSRRRPPASVCRTGSVARGAPPRPRRETWRDPHEVVDDGTGRLAGGGFHVVRGKGSKAKQSRSHLSDPTSIDIYVRARRDRSRARERVPPQERLRRGSDPRVCARPIRQKDGRRNRRRCSPCYR